jgi:L-aspartate oxidase
VDAAVEDLAPAPVRHLMDAHLGVVREARGLEAARESLLSRIATQVQGQGGASDLSLLALMITQAALERRESRGAHLRLDFPNTASEARSSRLTLAGVLSSLGAPIQSAMKAQEA